MWPPHNLPTTVVLQLKGEPYLFIGAHLLHLYWLLMPHFAYSTVQFQTPGFVKMLFLEELRLYETALNEGANCLLCLCEELIQQVLLPRMTTDCGQVTAGMHRGG